MLMRQLLLALSPLQPRSYSKGSGRRCGHLWPLCSLNSHVQPATTHVLLLPIHAAAAPLLALVHASCAAFLHDPPPPFLLSVAPLLSFALVPPKKQPPPLQVCTAQPQCTLAPAQCQAHSPPITISTQLQLAGPCVHSGMHRKTSSPILLSHRLTCCMATPCIRAPSAD